MAEEPVVEGRLRFLEQAQVRQAGLARGRQRQRARAFVEGGGNGEDDQLLPLERRLAESGAARRHAHARDSWRWPRPATPCSPCRRRPRAGSAARRSTAACDSQLLALATSRPGTCAPRSSARRPAITGSSFSSTGHGSCSSPGIDLAGGRMVANRRQQRSRRDLPGSDELFDLEQFDLLPAGRVRRRRRCCWCPDRCRQCTVSSCSSECCEDHQVNRPLEDCGTASGQGH
jgi:hypothetical protein